MVNNDSNYIYSENDKEYSDLSSYNIINRVQKLLDKNGKDLSDLSSYYTQSKDDDRNIKDELQSELDYLSNLNSTLSSSKPFNSDKGQSKINRKKDNQYRSSSISSKSSYTESITESTPNTNLKEDNYSYDSMDHPKGETSFSTFNKQLNNDCNELEHKLIKVCSGILGNIDNDGKYKEDNYGINNINKNDY